MYQLIMASLEGMNFVQHLGFEMGEYYFTLAT